MHPPFYLVIDLEATCAEDQEVPRSEREIIEIGAVILSSSSWEIVSEFQTFIRPVRHRRLTPFCTKLTSISQSQVDEAPGFAVGLDALVQWATPYEGALFSSWGDYDRKQFQSDCAFHALPYPFNDHLNLKTLFPTDPRWKKRKLPLSEALALMGLKFEGTAHRGLDDARNIAKVVTAWFQRQPR